MKQIELTRGLFARVDDGDYERVWCYLWMTNEKKTTFYAVTKQLPQIGKFVYMHNVIFPPPPGFEIHHKDWNGLNNQRSNMEHLTHAENLAKRRPKLERFIFWHIHTQKWRVQVLQNNKLYYGGYHDKLEDAIIARDVLITTI